MYDVVCCNYFFLSLAISFLTWEAAPDATHVTECRTDISMYLSSSSDN